MTEKILKSLLRLFAIITDFDDTEGEQQARELVRIYLEKFFSRTMVNNYLSAFDQYLQYYSQREEWGEEDNRDSLANIRVQKICDEINIELQGEDKILIVLELLEFINNKDAYISDKEVEFISTIAGKLNIDQHDYTNLRLFVLDKLESVPQHDTILIINGIENFHHQNSYKHIYSERLRGSVYVLHIKSTSTFIFKYVGQRNMYLNGHKIETNRCYPLASGSIIKTSRSRPVYYSHVAGKFIHAQNKTTITLKARDVEYFFPNSSNGLHRLNFAEDSGRLVGIMGSSGTGKSTMLNILNGNIVPHKGEITINGYHLQKDGEALKGLIGFVPQEDLLIEELTVYQNLYFNARLCFADFSVQQVHEIVHQSLIDFDLFDAKDLMVGNPLRKYISGGQRKRLNIALELMREPSILFVDEPTSGLSSIDSEKVMLLIKRQTIKGRLVIVNIHQPSSDIYKLLDRIIILDIGGRVIYNGYPLNALVYFKEQAKYINPFETECQLCGNVKAEQPLRIIESRMVDTHGRVVRKRKVSPAEWFELYQKNLEPKFTGRTGWYDEEKKKTLPDTNFKKPGLNGQFMLFSKRNLLSKLSNRQYLWMALLEAPLLAFILAYFTRFLTGSDEENLTYIFSENKNLPVYLFMSIIVALFIGLMISAEEIYKDRKIIKRESFLNLSRFSYLNSKISVLFAISAIQSLLFVLVGNSILEIKGMWFSYWLAIFTTTCTANMIGLNISSGFNSAVTIYITIPLIMVPQLLFSGVVINFNDLHSGISSKKYVPLVGDITASRWAYEAIAVRQFKNNEYQEHFFDAERKISQANFKSVYLIPNLKNKLSILNEKPQLSEKKQEELTGLIKNELTILKNELPGISGLFEKCIPPESGALKASSCMQALDSAKSIYLQKEKEALKIKDSIYYALEKKIGRDGIIRLKKQHYNNKLDAYLRDRLNYNKIYETHDRIIQRKDPVLMEPLSKIGRAHFYAPCKIISDWNIDTFVFNLAILWLGCIILYFTLYWDLLRKIVEYIEKFKLRNPRLAMHKRV
jgi:ABC transport system ATP-binding/permease protein